MPKPEGSTAAIATSGRTTIANDTVAQDHLERANVGTAQARKVAWRPDLRVNLRERMTARALRAPARILADSGRWLAACTIA